MSLTEHIDLPDPRYYSRVFIWSPCQMQWDIVAQAIVLPGGTFHQRKNKTLHVSGHLDEAYKFQRELQTRLDVTRALLGYK